MQLPITAHITFTVDCLQIRTSSGCSACIECGTTFLSNGSLKGFELTFTGQMAFLMHNQKCQCTDDKNNNSHKAN